MRGLGVGIECRLCDEPRTVAHIEKDGTDRLVCRCCDRVPIYAWEKKCPHR